MSLFSWFSRKPAPAKPRPIVEPSGLLNADATVPLTPGRQARPAVEPLPPDHAANRKNERMERRELLYTVVRDAMVRAGVLSASYKFKVLSLDQRGRQFLVMMDVAREYGGETVRLSEIEALIAQTAKTRYDILVTAVYWRINDHVAIGIPQRGLNTQAGAHGSRRTGATAGAVSSASVAAPAAPAASPAVPTAAAATTAALRSASHAASAGRPAPDAAPSAPSPLSAAPTEASRPQAGKFEPIEADEVAAFKRALAIAAGAASTAGAAAAAAARPGVAVHSGPLLTPSAPTGFEDTQVPVTDGVSQDLSTTQYGELN